MPEKFQRRTILDPTVADLLNDMEQRQAESQLPRRQREKKARERAKIQARREQRATYDLPPALRTKIKELAESEGVPASQLVTLALLRFFQDQSAGKFKLSDFKQPSRSPRYDWNLIFPEDLFPKDVLKKKRKE
jgi:hypothetical protein